MENRFVAGVSVGVAGALVVQWLLNRRSDKVEPNYVGRGRSLSEEEIGSEKSMGPQVHQAVGFAEFREKFAAAAGRRLRAADLVPRLKLDARIDVAEL